MLRAGLSVFMLLFFGACTSIQPKPSNSPPPSIERKSISHPTCNKNEANITGILVSIKSKEQTTINKMAVYPYQPHERLILPGTLLREVLWFDDKFVMFSEIMHDGDDAFIFAVISFEKNSNGSSSTSSIALKTCEERELAVRGPDGRQLILNAKIEFVNDIIVQ